MIVPHKNPRRPRTFSVARHFWATRRFATRRRCEAPSDAALRLPISAFGMHLQNFGAMSAGTSERALLGTRRWCRRRSSALANQRTCCRCRNQSEERAGICTQMPQSVALVIASEPENRRQVLGLDSADEPRRLLRLRVWHVLVGWSCDLHQVRSQKVQGSTLHATTAEPGSTQKPALRQSAQSVLPASSLLLSAPVQPPSAPTVDLANMRLQGLWHAQSVMLEP